MAEVPSTVHHMRVGGTLYELEDQVARQSAGHTIAERVTYEIHDEGTPEEEVISVKDKIEEVEEHIPTKTSDLTNDTDFITREDLSSTLVTSINNQTGDVTLNASDVGAVSSVNNKTGAVTLNASDVGAVSSVNNKTGAVTLTAEDVNALGDEGVQKIYVHSHSPKTKPYYAGLNIGDNYIDNKILNNTNASSDAYTLIFLGGYNNTIMLEDSLSIDDNLDVYGCILSGLQNHYKAFDSNGYSWGIPSMTIGSMNNNNSCYTFSFGAGLTTYNPYSMVIGRENKVGTKAYEERPATQATGDAFVIGNGNNSNKSNAFRVTFDGATYGLTSYNSSGADYAEYFEWLDENPNAEDRVGYFVTLDGKMIKKANQGDYILGIVSALPALIGNADEDWLGRWLKDDFGRIIEEEHTVYTYPDDDEVTVNPETGERTHSKEKENITVYGRIQNPDYDPTQPYIERKDRKEWSAVGMMGVLAVRDDGSCEVNRFCDVADGGIATAGETYRVIERVSNQVVKIIFK